MIESHGTLADTFAFGFSTKYLDRETELVAYQRRFYSPALGRWLNRDPIEEEGGENLYAFCGNNPVAKYDLLGMNTCCREGKKISCGSVFDWTGTVTTAAGGNVLGIAFVTIDLVSSYICTTCTRYRLRAKAVLPLLTAGAAISLTGSDVQFKNVSPESFAGSVSLISAGVGAMGVAEYSRLSIGNAMSSSFGVVGGAEFGASAGYGWFVDFELTEE